MWQAARRQAAPEDTAGAQGGTELRLERIEKRMDKMERLMERVAASLEEVSFARSSNLCLLILSQTPQQLRKLNLSSCGGLAALEASFSGKVNLNISGCRELQRLVLRAEQFEGCTWSGIGQQLLACDMSSVRPSRPTRSRPRTPLDHMQ